MYRLDEQSSVGTYTLAPGAAPSAGTTFAAVQPPSIGLPDDVLGRLAALASTSQTDGLNPIANGATAAEIQLAIWSLADNIPLTAQTVPNTGLRSAAAQLLVSSGQGKAPVPSYATQPQIDITPHGADAQNQQLRVTLSIDSSETSFDDPQAIDMRLDGVWATFCTGNETSIQTDEATSVADSLTLCGSARHDGKSADRGRYRTTIDHTGEDNNIATLDFPRSSRTKSIEMYWNFDQDPGMILIPSDDGPAIMTADKAHLTLTEQTSIDPSALSDAETSGEQIAVAWLVHSGWLGVVIAIAALIVILFLKDIVRGVGKGIWWLVRRGWRRPPDRPSDTSSPTVHLPIQRYRPVDVSSPSGRIRRLSEQRRRINGVR